MVIMLRDVEDTMVSSVYHHLLNWAAKPKRESPADHLRLRNYVCGLACKSQIVYDLGVENFLHKATEVENRSEYLPSRNDFR